MQKSSDFAPYIARPMVGHKRCRKCNVLVISTCFRRNIILFVKTSKKRVKLDFKARRHTKVINVETCKIDNYSHWKVRTELRRCTC